MKLIRWMTFLVLSIVAVAVAVSNRGAVTVQLDPFSDVNPAIRFDLPLFIVMFACLLVGLVLGALTVWLAQWKWRRLAAREARRARDLERQIARIERGEDAAEPGLAA